LRTEPCRSSRRIRFPPRRANDGYLDKQGVRIGCPFGKLEPFRRVFGRFDKLARRHLAFVHLAAGCILLR
jgi:hypothetical protein